MLGSDGRKGAVGEVAGDGPSPQVAMHKAWCDYVSTSSHSVRVWFDCRCTCLFDWLIPESSELGDAGLIDETLQKAQRA